MYDVQLARRVALLADAGRRYPHYGALTADTIDLAAGDPTFPTPEHVQAAGILGIQTGQTRYTDVRGAPELRSAVRKKFARENALTYGDDQVIVGNGSKQVLANALIATIEPGDEVVLLAPHYGVFAQMIALVEGRAVVVACDPAGGYRFDHSALEAALSPRTSWVILNNPVNPTGVVFTKEELHSFVEVVTAHPRAGIISDEIYEHLYYGAIRPTSPAAVSDRAYERTLTVNGLSKAYSMTGWRIGYGGGPRELIAAMTRIQNATTSCASAVSQAAALEALGGSQEGVEALRVRYAHLSRVAFDTMAAAPYLSPILPEGGLYVLADCQPAIGLTTPAGERIADDVALVEYLAERASVRTMPGSVFAAPGMLRISFATDEDTLRGALTRITAALEELT